VASTAVSPAKVVVVDSDEVGRSAVYSKCNSGPRTLLCSQCEPSLENGCYVNRILG
jgi:hypothetical protein